jgi:hypothetical protein
MHVQNHDLSAAAEIFANSTYFSNMLLRCSIVSDLLKGKWKS